MFGKSKPQTSPSGARKAKDTSEAAREDLLTAMYQKNEILKRKTSSSSDKRGISPPGNQRGISPSGNKTATSSSGRGHMSKAAIVGQLEAAIADGLEPERQIQPDLAKSNRNEKPPFKPKLKGGSDKKHERRKSPGGFS